MFLLFLLLGNVNNSVASYKTYRRIQNAAAVVSIVYLIFAGVVVYKQSVTNKPKQAQLVKEKFADVAGAYQAKAELKDIVDYLKDPKKYSALGARASKGILLTGEPGNGKTLLARAVAGEAGCPFYHMSGSEFINMYVGVGANKVRELFKVARETAPSIIFIDEIDAIGGSRNNANYGGNEYAQTLNQLLTCMDGFDQSDSPIIVIAATNLPDSLDKALLRPGRFDRIIDVPYPDLKARVDILNIYIKNIVVDPSLDINKIAQGTINFSGADLANLVNQAALLATKAGKQQVDLLDFEAARDLIMMGALNTTRLITEQDRKITAYHEAGHALVGIMIPENPNMLHKVTIMPRGQTLGVAYSLPERERSHGYNKDEYLSQIAMACGGRVAEEMVFGHITTGAYSDFKFATDLARRMVCSYGMSGSPALGKAVYVQDKNNFSYSLETAKEIDLAVNRLIDESYERAKQILTNHRDKLDKLAQALLEKETLYASEIYELLEMTPKADLSFCLA